MSKKKLQEMGLKAKGWWTFALGITCIAIMSFLFIDPFSGCHIEDSYKINFAGDVIESTYRYFDYLYVLQWIALGCLAFILWMWREKLGIDGLGPMHGSKDPHIGFDLTSVPNEETSSVPENDDVQTEAGPIQESEPSIPQNDANPSVPENGDVQTGAGPIQETEPSIPQNDANPSVPENGDVQTGAGPIQEIGPSTSRSDANPSVPESSDVQTEDGPIPESEPSTIRNDANPSIPESNDVQTEAGPIPESEPSTERSDDNASVPENRDTQTAAPPISRNTHSASFVRLRETNRTRIESIQKLIADVIKKYKKISVEDLARSIRYPSFIVYRILRESKNLYRLDGIGIKSIVTPINSIENIVLDSIYDEISVNGDARQYRQAVVGEHKVDAIFRTRSDLYVISLLNVNISKVKNVVGKEIRKLNKVSKQFNKVNKHIIVVFIGQIEEIEKQKRREMIIRHCRAINNLEIRFFNQI
ncbi:hypothetical protein SAMN05720473_1135 [Fibrobacter sp. UWB15]|uniref:hypothetical protein n=1 Tax=unclassified Fibrobacter TaxID=2634177 RepID=UPI00091F51E9|nr:MULTISPECIES: hypothetical protein [unclassified Fibrobacter]PWJ61928.1 hypothetical protein BGW99_1145 [Fibrobacter sp. UWB6]SHG58418.1 hypothetical protein SAMN05720760_11550 [Fibrobacter sp. UWB8]SMG41993.1 hypothetical protein SAMN05720473_1135 [Fibrobacter sp. UWB15]